jgi:hypothetical protein
MYVWNGNPAVLLTTWAKTTTADSDPEKAGSRGFVSFPGFGLGSTEPRHSFLDSLLASSRTVVGKVAVEAVENCPSSTLLTSFVLHPYI